MSEKFGMKCELFSFDFNICDKNVFRVFSEAKQKQEKTEPPCQNICNLDQSGVSAQESQPVTSQVRLPIELIKTCVT